MEETISDSSFGVFIWQTLQILILAAFVYILYRVFKKVRKNTNS